jgi:hypothetical protein
MPKTARVQSDGQPGLTVEVLASSIADEARQRYALNLGEQGLRWSDWAALRVVANTDELGEQWLLIRRTVAQTPDVTYFFSNAPQQTALTVLAQVAASRYPIEHVLEEAKGTTGLGQYEVRYWHSWYRHMTLALLAHAWLTLLRLDDAQKYSPTLSLFGSSSVSRS